MSLPSALTTVTPLSKKLALVTFIIIPFVTFFVGLQHGKKSSITPPQPSPQTMLQVTPQQIIVTATPVIQIGNLYKMKNPSWQLYRDPQNNFTLELPPEWKLYEYSYKTRAFLSKSGKIEIDILSKKLSGTSPKDIYSQDTNYFEVSDSTSDNMNVKEIMNSDKVYAVNSPVGGDSAPGARAIISIVYLNGRAFNVRFYNENDTVLFKKVIDTFQSSN